MQSLSDNLDHAGFRIEIADRNKLSDSLSTASLESAFKPFASVESKRLFLVPVHVWGQFTPALNALLFTATEYRFPYIFYLSLEVVLHANQVKAMAMEHIAGHDVLVVGKRFLNDHRFTEGNQLLDGLTSPWNTASLWNVQQLSRTGFLMVSDGTQPGKFDLYLIIANLLCRRSRRDRGSNSDCASSTIDASFHSYAGGLRK